LACLKNVVNMLSGYVLKIEINAINSKISEKEFRELVDPSLAHLEHLKRSFDRSPNTNRFYPPDIENEKHSWSVVAVVLISVGEERGMALLQLHKPIALDVEIMEYVQSEQKEANRHIDDLENLSS